MFACTRIAASSRFWSARAANACVACVSGSAAEDVVVLGLMSSISKLSAGGKSRRTMMTFICGRLDVATARRPGSCGLRARPEGEKVTQELE